MKTAMSLPRYKPIQRDIAGKKHSLRYSVIQDERAKEHSNDIVFEIFKKVKSNMENLKFI